MSYLLQYFFSYLIFLVAIFVFICIITGIWGFIGIANLAALGTIIYSSIKLGQCFGRDSSFIVGLCLLSIVFMAIIAFSKDINYLGNNNN